MSARAAGLLLRRGRLARELGVRLDLATSLGPRATLARGVADRRRARAPDARGAFYRSLWAESARAVGAELVATEPPDGFELRRGERRVRVHRGSVEIEDPHAVARSLDKLAVHRELREAGVPVPAFAEVHAPDLAPARAFLLAQGGPCVLKPADDEAGSGVTAGVTGDAQLARAALRAARLQPRLVIERQLDGPVHRLLILDGELIGAVRRHAPRVVGDGRSTIARLVAAENRRRLRDGSRFSPLHLDLDALLALEASGLTPRSVPAAGAAVAIKTVTQQGRAEDGETVPAGAIAPAVLADAARAASVVGLRLAGVDLITPDAGRPLAETGGAVIEVNADPGLHHHYQVADPETATPVAVRMLERLLQP